MFGVLSTSVTAAPASAPTTNAESAITASAEAPFTALILTALQRSSLNNMHQCNVVSVLLLSICLYLCYFNYYANCVVFIVVCRFHKRCWLQLLWYWMHSCVALNEYALAIDICRCFLKHHSTDDLDELSTNTENEDSKAIREKNANMAKAVVSQIWMIRAMSFLCIGIDSCVLVLTYVSCYNAIILTGSPYLAHLNARQGQFSYKEYPCVDDVLMMFQKCEMDFICASTASRGTLSTGDGVRGVSTTPFEVRISTVCLQCTLTVTFVCATIDREKCCASFTVCRRSCNSKCQ